MVFRTKLNGWLISGISVGGCIEGGPIKRSEYAHSHNVSTNNLYGWICVEGIWQLGYYNADPKRYNELEIVIPSDTLVHEYAHILTPDHGHDKPWRRRYDEIKKDIPYIKGR